MKKSDIAILLAELAELQNKRNQLKREIQELSKIINGIAECTVTVPAEEAA